MSKFCSKCGKEINGAAFCPYCGAKADGSQGKAIPKPNFNMNLSLLGTNGYYWFMAAVSVVLAVMTFFNWFTVSIPSIITTKLNCFSFVIKSFKIANSLDIMEDFGLVILMGIILFLLAGFVILFTIKACRCALINSNETILYSKTACGFSMVLSVITIGFVSFAKSVLESEMGFVGGMIGDIMSLSSHPYIMLVIAIVGIVFGNTTDRVNKPMAMIEYANILNQLENKDNYKFKLIHTDDNKVPALAILPRGHENSDRAMIYRYYNGKAVLLRHYDNKSDQYIGFFGSKGVFGYEPHSNRLLQKVVIDDDYTASEVYFLSDDGEHLIIAMEGVASEHLDEYRINGNEVHSYTYNDAFSGFTMVNEKDGYEINETNIREILIG